MKTQNRIRKEASVNGAGKQVRKIGEGAPAPQAVNRDVLRILLDLPGLGRDGEPVWFAPDGRLFLWDGDLSQSPREIGFKEGRAWFELYASQRPEFEPPLLPERTAGRELVDWVKKEQRARVSNAGLNRKVDGEELALLVLAGDKTEDALWALPNGRLFLWSGGPNEPHREVSLEQARDWWNQFCKDDPDFAPPFFPEHSPAAKIVTMVCAAIRQHNRRGSAAASSAVIPLTLFLRMESPVREAMALLTMFARRISVRCELESNGQARENARGVGCFTLAGKCATELFDLWQAAHADAQALRTGGARPVVQAGENPAAVALQFPVERAAMLLNLMAEELADRDDEADARDAKRQGQIPTVGASGYIAAAQGCIAGLRSAFEAAFAEWSALDKAAEQRLAA